MTKNRLLAVLLAGLILISLAGCAVQNSTLPEESDSDISAAITAGATSATETSDTGAEAEISDTEESETENEESQAPTESSTAEKEESQATEPTATEEPTETSRTESEPEETEPAETKPQTTVTKPPAEETTATETTEPPAQTTEKPEETEPPKQTTEQPEVTEPPKVTEPPAESQTPEATEPETDAFTEADHKRIIAEVTAYAQSYASKGFTFEWKESMTFGWDVGYMGTPRVEYEGVDGVIKTLKYHIDLIYKTSTDPMYGITTEYMTYKVEQITVDGDLAYVVIYGG